MLEPLLRKQFGIGEGVEEESVRLDEGTLAWLMTYDATMKRKDTLSDTS